MTAYIIATTPRSGSFLLCEGLARTGIAGLPQEYAPADDFITWLDFHRCHSHAEYFFRFPDLCRTPNGVVGVKLMWSQWIAWGLEACGYLRIDRSAADAIRLMIGQFCFIRLVREDRLRQAISWVRARQTGLWSSRLVRIQPERAAQVVYDAGLIRDALEQLEKQNRAWDALVTAVGVPVFHLEYVELVADYRGAVSRIVKFLGLRNSRPLPAKPELLRQADEITEQWAERARHDLGAV